MIGPTGETRVLDEAMAKFEARAERWARLGLGAFLSNRMYNVFCLSVLGFLAQFFHPPDKLLQAEKHALATMFKGPRKWISP